MTATTVAERREADARYQRTKAYARAHPEWSGNRPETLGEARNWETVKNKYLADGLCHECASQAAYGHQLGFRHIAPPRVVCAPIVARFPKPAGKDSAWRRWPVGHNARSPLGRCWWPLQCAPQGCRVVRVHLTLNRR